MKEKKNLPERKNIFSKRAKWIKDPHPDTLWNFRTQGTKGRPLELQMEIIKINS